MQKKTLSCTLLSLLTFIISCSDGPKTPFNASFFETSSFQSDLLSNLNIKENLLQRELFNTVLYEEEAEDGTATFLKKKGVISHHSIPYFHYWLLKDKQAFVLHPMRFGCYLDDHARELAFDTTFYKSLEHIGYRQPQTGGLAFYYPEHYQLNRMKGPDITYSAISQSQILSGFMSLASINSDYEIYVDDALKALMLDYYDGGVNLVNKAFLEIPLQRSAPEIILNGWLHALLRLNDYTRNYQDTAIHNILLNNVNFLTRNIDKWYDEERKISKYSDMTPYLIDISLTGQSHFTENIAIKYKSLEEGFQDQQIILGSSDTTVFGGYDNHIVSQSGNSVECYINMSLFFDTHIIADAAFEVKINVGSYNPLMAAPDNGNETITLASVYDTNANQHKVDLSSIKKVAHCGYPTNFSKKNGKNYYHVQHIIALLYLANFCDGIKGNDRQKLIQTAKKWYDNTLAYEHMPITAFKSPQVILNGINRGKVNIDVSQVEELFAMSGIQQSW